MYSTHFFFTFYFVLRVAVIVNMTVINPKELELEGHRDTCLADLKVEVGSTFSGMEPGTWSSGGIKAALSSDDLFP